MIGVNHHDGDGDDGFDDNLIMIIIMISHSAATPSEIFFENSAMSCLMHHFEHIFMI